MRVEVINYGPAMIVPTCQGDLYINHLPGPMIMELQKQAAEEVNVQPGMKVIFPEIVIPPRREKPAVIDYSGYRAQELRSMAAQRKIPGFFTMKKVDLIELLKKTEDKNGTKNR